MPEIERRRDTTWVVLRETSKSWVAVVGYLSLLASIVQFVRGARHDAEWLIAATLALLLMSSMVAHGRERRKRLVAEALPNPTTEQARRTLLRPLIEAAVTRGEHMATLTDVNPAWLVPRYEKWGTENYDRLNDALGPTEADGFAEAGEISNPRPGLAGMQDQIAARVAWLRSLLDRLDSVPIMGDWHP